MKKSAMIIINPSSGKEKAAKYKDKIRTVLKKSYDEIEVMYTEKAGDATRFASDAGNKGFDLVVSLGGDGTVNETVNGLAGFENPPVLGIVPMGTVNDLARALKIPLKPDDAISLLGSGFEKIIDVGKVNDRYFTNIVGIGNVAEAIHDVDSEEKSKLGPLAYFLASAREILDGETFPVELNMDKEQWQGEISVVIAGLIDSLGGIRTFFPEAEISGGVFHILAIEKLDIPKAMKITSSLLAGKLSKSDNVHYFKSKTLKVNTIDGDMLGSDVDGEKGPNLPLVLSVLPGHLTVISGMED
ncbi:MAG: diacylglycerol/lipid kinase family protein [Bacillota bacterium]